MSEKPIANDRLFGRVLSLRSCRGLGKTLAAGIVIVAMLAACSVPSSTTTRSVPSSTTIPTETSTTEPPVTTLATTTSIVPGDDEPVPTVETGPTTSAAVPDTSPLATGTETVALANGVTLVLDAGSISPGATIVQRLVDVAPPDGMERVGGDPIELTIDGGEMTGTVRLEFPYDPALVAEGSSPHSTFAIVTAAHEGAPWTSVDFAVDVDRKVLVVETDHFSIWDDVKHGVSQLLWGISEAAGWLTQGIGQALGNRAGPPVCGGSGRHAAPSWVRNYSVSNYSNAVVRACVEGEGDLAVIELVNNRKYPMVMDYGRPVAWGWTERPSGLGDALVSDYMQTRVGPNQLYLPPLSRAAIGVPRGDWLLAEFTIRPVRASVAALVLSMVIDQLGSQVTGTVTAGLGGQCLNDYVVGNLFDPMPNDRGKVGELTKNVASCLGDALEAGGVAGLAEVGLDTGQLQRAWKTLKYFSAATLGAEIGGAMTPLIDYFVGDLHPTVLSLTQRPDPVVTSPPATNPPATAPPATAPPATSPPATTQPPAPPAPTRGSISASGRRGSCPFGSNCLIAAFSVSGFSPHPGSYTCVFSDGFRASFAFSGSSVNTACYTAEAGDWIEIEINGVRSNRVTSPTASPTAPATTVAPAPQRTISASGRRGSCPFGSNCLIAAFSVSGFSPHPGSYTCVFSDGFRASFAFSGSSVNTACYTAEAGDWIEIEINGVRSNRVT